MFIDLYLENHLKIIKLNYLEQKLKKYILSEQESNWIRCYEKIVDRVQEEMKRSHGCRIFTDFKF